MYAMNKAKQYGYKKLVLYYDYAGIGNWCERLWTAKNKYSKLYVEYYDKNIKPFIEVEFIKVKSHSKNTYNDMADFLAKQALMA
jgi:ribonuclease HI